MKKGKWHTRRFSLYMIVICSAMEAQLTKYLCSIIIDENLRVIFRYRNSMFDPYIIIFKIFKEFTLKVNRIKLVDAILFF